MNLGDDTAEFPVTVLVSHVVKRGAESAFATWAAGISRAALGFPGHRGVQVIRTGGGGGRQFLLLFSFAGEADLQAWERSETRRWWLARATDLVEKAPHVQALTGLEAWFSLSGEPGPPAPARYKMAAVVEFAIFPLLAVLTFALTPLLASFPTLLRLLITSIVMVLVMTYAVMPTMTRIFRRWLYS